MGRLETDIQLLERVPLLTGFGPEPLKLIAFSSESREIGDGQTLFEAGERADGGYVVTQGRIDLVGADGTMVLAALGPGSLIGEMALIVDTTRPAKAVASGPTRVIHVRRSVFRRVLAEYPKLAAEIGKSIASRIQATAADLQSVRETLQQID